MMVNCPNCGTPNPAGFRFCGNCAAALPAAAGEPAERRKVVTIFFCDVVGSTQLGEKRDAESVRAVMNRYFATVRSAIEQHGGTVEKFIGDAVMAVFGHPLLHEDDALRAVRAAAELQFGMAGLNERLEREWGVALQTRIGINTGPVVAGEAGAGGTFVTGDAVNVAARLQTAAGEGETLMGEQTHRLVRDAVVAQEITPLALKGKELPVPAWRLQSVIQNASGHARRLDSPLVGRERERELLDGAFKQAVADRGCVLVNVVGTAGVGKSRLVHEFVSGARVSATVVRGRCLPYGVGITFWPLAEVVKQVAGIDEGDTTQVAQLKIENAVSADTHGAVISGLLNAAIGLGGEAGAADEIFWAARRFLEHVAAQRPLVVVFDDIQWAEPAFLEMVEHITDWSRAVPLLLVCVARPELLEDRPDWAVDKPNSTTLVLDALSNEHVATLIGNLLGEATLSRTVLERIAEASAGNPLFVEEFVAMLIDDGLLRPHNGGWSAAGDMEHVEVPGTIRLLLAARIDRLAAPERRVIERASVVGKVFWRGAVAELAPPSVRAETGPSLTSLVEKQLVRSDASDFAGDEAFRFRHLLLRDAAYDGLTKRDRAELHTRFCGWLERMAGERIGEFHELLGYHLEQAYRYRLELGPPDATAVDLGRTAGRHLLAGGERALDRGDPAAAAKLLERATALLPRSAPDHAEATLSLTGALVELGQFDEAKRRLDEVGEPAADAPARSRWRTTRQRLRIALGTDLDRLLTHGDAEVDAAIAELESADDDIALAEAWTQRGEIAYVKGDLALSLNCHERALVHAQRAGALSLEATLRGEIASSAVWDDQPLAESIDHAKQALAWVRSTGGRLGEARLLGILGRLTALAGDVAEGRRLVIEARQIIAELGRRVHHAGSTQWLAMVDFAAWDLAAAERDLRDGAEVLDSLGERSFLSSSLAEMAVAIALQGRIDEADQAALRARELAATDDVEAQQFVTVVMAVVALERGRPEEAARLAAAALAAGDATQYFYSRILSRIVLAPVVRATAGDQTAARVLRETAEMARHKGITPFVARIEAQLAEIDAQPAGISPSA